MSNFKYLITPDEVYIDSAGNRFYIEAFLDPFEVRERLTQMSAVIATAARMGVEPNKPPQKIWFEPRMPLEIKVRWYPAKKEETDGVATGGEPDFPADFHGDTG